MLPEPMKTGPLFLIGGGTGVGVTITETVSLTSTVSLAGVGTEGGAQETIKDSNAIAKFKTVANLRNINFSSGLL
jgi:hypothetical protein